MTLKRAPLISVGFARRDRQPPGWTGGTLVPFSHPKASLFSLPTLTLSFRHISQAATGPLFVTSSPSPSPCQPPLSKEGVSPHFSTTHERAKGIHNLFTLLFPPPRLRNLSLSMTCIYSFLGSCVCMFWMGGEGTWGTKDGWDGPDGWLIEEKKIFLWCICIYTTREGKAGFYILNIGFFVRRERERCVCVCVCVFVEWMKKWYFWDGADFFVVDVCN